MTAYIWDLDGTLLDSYAVIVKGAKAAAEEAGLHDTDGEVLKGVKGESVTSYLRNASARAGIPFEQMKERYRFFAHALDDEITLIDGAAETLERLRREGAEHFVYTHRGASSRPILQRLGILFFLAVVIALAASWVLYRTRAGLHLRAVGENPATADAVGINVTACKYLAICIGSGISGLGGFYYIIDYMGSQEAYLSVEAFGWLSIALVIFALWRPHLTLIGSVAFGFLFSCSSFITNIPGIFVTMAIKPILRMLPYVVTILVLIISSIRNKRENQPPASLGLSYFREER